MPVLSLLCIAFFAGLVIVSLIMEADRSRHLKEWASQNGFTYLGREIPKSIDPDGAGIGGISSIWNVYEGQADGVRVVFFDCRIGRGKGSWRRTMIAAQAPRNVLATIPPEPGMTVDHQEGWHILYRSLMPSFGLRPFMPVEEIAARFRAIHQISVSE